MAVSRRNGEAAAVSERGSRPIRPARLGRPIGKRRRDAVSSSFCLDLPAVPARHGSPLGAGLCTGPGSDRHAAAERHHELCRVGLFDQQHRQLDHDPVCGDPGQRDRAALARACWAPAPGPAVPGSMARARAPTPLASSVPTPVPGSANTSISPARRPRPGVLPSRRSMPAARPRSPVIMVRPAISRSPTRTTPTRWSTPKMPGRVSRFLPRTTSSPTSSSDSSISRVTL